MSNIKAIRERLGLTQAALAEGIGCTQGNVGHFESKGQTVLPETAKRLIAFAATLGHMVTYEEIYGPAETPKTSESAAESKDRAKANGDKHKKAAKPKRKTPKKRNPDHSNGHKER